MDHVIEGLVIAGLVIVGLMTTALHLINVFCKEGLLDDVTVEKQWGWMAGGPNLGWWQIQSDFSL